METTGTKRIDVVTITLDEYDGMKEDCHILECLRNAGVDNWEGFDIAMEEYDEGRG